MPQSRSTKRPNSSKKMQPHREEQAELPGLPPAALEAAEGPFFDPLRFAGPEGREERSRFRKIVYSYYNEHGRSFPWRNTHDPWAVLVSEIMLQQTQTERVVPKYKEFMLHFPTAASLASAPLSELLPIWSGLGYNRRALALKRAAAQIVELYGGVLPADEEKLDGLDGVGPYTARAVMAFAFGYPSAFIETNIRSVFIYHFFPGAETVSDREIEPLVSAALDSDDPRSWYYALMDYGVALKKKTGNPSRRSSAYARQSPFAGSHRRIRGAVLRELSLGRPGQQNRGAEDGLFAAENSAAAALGTAEVEGRNARPLSRDELARRLPFAREGVEKAVDELIAEGFIEERKGMLSPAGQKTGSGTKDRG